MRENLLLEGLRGLLELRVVARELLEGKSVLRDLVLDCGESVRLNQMGGTEFALPIPGANVRGSVWTILLGGVLRLALGLESSVG